MDESHSAYSNIKLSAYSVSAHCSEWFKNKGSIKEEDRWIFNAPKYPIRQSKFEESKELKTSFQSKLDYQNSFVDIGINFQVPSEGREIDKQQLSSKNRKNIPNKEGSSKTATSPSQIGIFGMNQNENPGVHDYSSILNRVNVLTPIAESNNENSPPESKFIITMRDIKEHPEYN